MHTARLILARVGLLCAALMVSMETASARMNVLLITVDDMNCDSVGVFGCPIPGITPHIDRLASEGIRFEQAHVTIAICQPTRAVWMTGRYPHNNGALGFDPIKPGIPTLPETLKASGYYTGLMAKHGHVIPTRRAGFDEIVPARELRNGRSPEAYYRKAKAFFESAKTSGKPFFLMANSQDPHRPFAGSAQERQRRGRDRGNPSHQYGGGFPEARVAYDPRTIPVPGFLPDLPDIRQELAEYYTSVHRADAIAGAVLRALKESGLAETTLVMFLSDHGMPLPFAKTNVWRHSTRTPWIIRWPGTVKPGAIDRRHLVSGIDLAPTVLEACGLPMMPGMDGRSFVTILKGNPQQDRDWAFTQINTIASKRRYTMRSVLNQRYGYIWNGWVDGKTAFRNESQSGLTFKAMQAAAAKQPGVAARVKHFVYRTPEEFYDYKTDPDARRNLIDDPAWADRIALFRRQLIASMEKTRDPERAAYQDFIRKTAR